ncbi:MAG: PAS domain S-box protein [Proteobacteria bacterium]|nr:MAG: PAS domain S-box protein [Pseudomonadota bacterium]
MDRSRIRHHGAKAREEALKENEERFRGIHDNSPADIYLKDTEGRYLLINKRFEEWDGHSASDSIGKSTYDLFPRHLADSYMAVDRKVIQSGETQEIEFEAMFAYGTTRLVATTKISVRDSLGKYNRRRHNQHRHHRPKADGSAAPPGPENGGCRSAHRWGGARFQQFSGLHFWACRNNRREAWRR